LTGGRFQDTDGTRLAHGTITFQLSQDAVVIAYPYAQVEANTIVTFDLDASGNISASPPSKIWSNAELSPTGTFYEVNLYAADGHKANRDGIDWMFLEPDGSTVDLGGQQPIGPGGPVVIVPLPGPPGPPGTPGGPTGYTGYTGPGVGEQGATGYTGYTGATGTSTGSNTGAFFYIIDGGGVVPSTGLRGTVNVPTNCTVSGWSLIADQAGSIVVDVLHSTFTGFPTNSSICGADKPTLASAQKNENLALTEWTPGLLAGDVLQFNVVSVAVATRICVTLFVTIP